MRTYIIRRLLLMIPTLVFISIVTFFMVRLIPGDIVDAINSRAIGDVKVDRAQMEAALGLDAPALVQYGRWLGLSRQVDGSYDGLFQGSLGTAWLGRRPVLDMLSKAWPVTLELGILGLAVSLIISVPIGIYSALRQNKVGDYVGRSFAIMCISVPDFWLGTLIIVMPSIWWGYMPSIMQIKFADDPIGNLGMFIVPALVLGMALSGMVMRMARTVMLEVLRQDYIRTAWSKGLRERTVVMRHALKNALIPVVTIVGSRVPVLIGGAVIIEQIFMLSGVGRLTIAALESRDEPLLSGLVLFFAAALVLINLVVDLSYGFLDPRIRYQ